jgi:hypothetical protein
MITIKLNFLCNQPSAGSEMKPPALKAEDMAVYSLVGAIAHLREL